MDKETITARELMNFMINNYKTDNQDEINDTIKIKAYYVGKENNKYDLTIVYSHKSLTIDLDDYYFSNEFHKQDLHSEENILIDHLYYMYYLKTKFLTDNDFLDHVIIDFSLLPNYIQKSYEETSKSFQHLIDEQGIEESNNNLINNMTIDKQPRSKILNFFLRK